MGCAPWAGWGPAVDDGSEKAGPWVTEGWGLWADSGAGKEVARSEPCESTLQMTRKPGSVWAPTGGPTSLLLLRDCPGHVSVPSPQGCLAWTPLL